MLKQDEWYECMFNGKEIATIMDEEGQKWVSIKSLCENLGIHFRRQQRKIQNDSMFRCSHKAIPSNGGIQKTLCIPIRQIEGWLFTINSNRVKKEIKPLLNTYKERCMQVLYEFWNNGIAVATQDDANLIKELKSQISYLEGENNNLEYRRRVGWREYYRTRDERDDLKKKVDYLFEENIRLKAANKPI